MQLLIDEAFAEKVIPADDSVRLLDEMVEGIDTSALMRAYNRIKKQLLAPQMSK